MSSIDSNADLRRRLAEVEGSISGLQYTRWNIQRQLKMATTTSGSCPILANLSREITSQIFMNCLRPWSSTLDSRYAPMLLLQVCREWRSIALESTPGLWTMLRFDFNSLPEAFVNGEKLEQFLNDCVARAGARPLSLALFAGHCHAPRLQEAAQRLIPAILQRLSSQIEVLELNIGITGYPATTPGFPLLRKLTLGGLYDQSGDDLPIPIFGTAPQLREVVMACAIPPSLFVIPWRDVAVFQGERLSSKECVNILRSAPSLVECRFTELELDGDTPTVSHRGLKSLKLEDDDIPKFLTLPALQHLKVTIVRAESVHLLPFISASAASLVTLTAPKIPLDSLSDMVALTDLALFQAPHDHVVALIALLDRTKNRDVLPQLQVLELNPCSPYVNTVLVDALSSRSMVAQDGAAMLRSFRQIWLPKTPRDALQGYYKEQGFAVVLVGMVKKGMKVYIGHADSGASLFNHEDVVYDPSRESLGGTWDAYPK
ncbi:hypothetical protein K438DRAFT_2075153 [Mycena galopus ATCC 62051]|nr:hypothetical protein K438DRAFT_2075153 [Mycena galopus ATCC 62051]